MTKRLLQTLFLLTITAALHADGHDKPAPLTTITGYVRDAGCVHRYPEIGKPLPNGCLEACVRAGSPLVILALDGSVYHPFSNEIPDQDVRPKLLPFAGKLVRVTGHLYKRGGSLAISLEGIAQVKE